MTQAPSAPDLRPRQRLRWTAGAVTRQGRDHAARGIPCQDAVALRRRPDGLLLAALADGAGSAPDAATGAQRAVAAAVATLDDGLGSWSGTEDLLTRLGEAVFAAAADALAGPSQACTLLFCAAFSDRLLAGQLGDGFIVTRDRDAAPEAYRRAVPGWRGEHINETPFLTDADWRTHARITVGPPAAFLCLSSDGLEGLAVRRRDDQPHGGFFQPLETFLAAAPPAPEKELAAFLAAPKTTARAADDLSLIAAAAR